MFAESGSFFYFFVDYFNLNLPSEFILNCCNEFITDTLAPHRRVLSCNIAPTCVYIYKGALVFGNGQSNKSNGISRLYYY